MSTLCETPSAEAEASVRSGRRLRSGRHSIFETSPPSTSEPNLPDQTSRQTSMFDGPMQPVESLVDGPHREMTHKSRRIVTRGVRAIPFLPSGSPLERDVCDGFTVEVGADGLTFEVDSSLGDPMARWMVGVELEDGQLGYAVVKTRQADRAGTRLRIDGRYTPDFEDPLRAANLEPIFDAETYRFCPRISAELLASWQSLGVAKPVLHDCVLVCPRCRALPTVRRGCRACGSIEVAQDELMHHFACAHVDLVTRFEAGDQIICPKCRVRDLVVGADFEFLPGPLECQDCGWSDRDLENIARCMACGFEFPEVEAVEEEVIGYHVERFEPLDLVAAH